MKTTGTGLTIVHNKDGSIDVTSKKMNEDYNKPIEEKVDDLPPLLKEVFGHFGQKFE